MTNLFIMNDNYCNPHPKYYWCNEHGCFYTYLTEFNLPNVKYYDDGSFYNTATNKVVKPQACGSIEVRSTLTGKKIRISKKSVDGYYFMSPWAFGIIVNQYKRLDCLGFSKYFAVDNGSIFSLYSNTYLVGEVKRGYMTLCMSDDNGKQCYPTMHKLIATAFVPNPYNRTTVDHIDCNKTNNAASNLRWAWPYENNGYARENGLRPLAITDEQVHHVCRRLQEGAMSIADIAKEVGTTVSIVNNIKSGDHRRISQYYDFDLNRNSRKMNSVYNGIIGKGLSWNFKDKK